MSAPTIAVSNHDHDWSRLPLRMNPNMQLQVILWSVLIGSIAGGIFLTLLIDYLTPGRRGKLRTERDHFFEGRSPAEIRAEMERRLAAEKFQIVPGTNPLLLNAKRTIHRPKGSIMKDYPFHKLKLSVEVRFSQREEGTSAKTAVTTLDTITRDTGEGEYLEVMLDYVMIMAKLRAINPVLNSTARIAMLNSVVTVFLPVLLFLPGMEGADDFRPGLSFLTGLIIAAFSNLLMAGWGMIEIATGNGKFTGYKFAVICAVLSVVAVGAALGIYFGLLMKS